MDCFIQTWIVIDWWLEWERTKGVFDSDEWGLVFMDYSDSDGRDEDVMSEE